MSTKDELGMRMKEKYENVSSISLEHRKPVAIRIDGKAFHNFTKGFVRPFDNILRETMKRTTLYLCQNIQGCVLGYTQSDEITLILIDYTNPNTQAWFDNKVQKICSISASMATMEFNRVFIVEVNNAYMNSSITEERYNIYYDKFYQAMFDSRCFNIPKEEVTNLLYWRQLDAIRNSIQLVGQSYFTQRELNHKSCGDIRNMLLTEKGVDWDNFTTSEKRGSCVIRKKWLTPNQPNPTNLESDQTREPNPWVIDDEIPVFKGDGREYVERLI